MFHILFFQVTDKAVERSLKDPGITAAMRTVFWMATEDISMSKYPSLVNFLKFQGCDNLTRIDVGKNACYNSRTAGEDFQECVGEVIENYVVAAIKKAPFFSVLIDESTDISISKQMVIYVRIVTENFEPRTFFLADICIEDVKSDAEVLFKHLTSYLEAKGLDISKCLGFGSDGASVMTGRHNGVATRVKKRNPFCISIHCMAHRLNLCSSQASKDIPYLKTFEKTMTELYYYFGGSKSGNRKCELQDIQRVLDDPQIKIKECHEIRWISFCSAIEAVFKTWLSLVTYFSRHSDSTSRSIHAKLTDYRFVYTMHFLLDILPHVAQLSLLLQKRDIDIAAVKPAVENLKNRVKSANNGSSYFQKELKDKLVQSKHKDGTVKELKFKGQKLDVGKDLSKLSKEMSEVKTSFCTNLKRNIEARFPQDSVDVSMAFHILSMRPLSFLSPDDIESYGTKEIDILSQHYGRDVVQDNVTFNRLVDPDKLPYEWSLTKQTVLEQLYPRDKTNQLLKLLHMYHQDSFPNLMVLANLAMIMPYQTADL